MGKVFAYGVVWTALENGCWCWCVSVCVCVCVGRLKRLLVKSGSTCHLAHGRCGIFPAVYSAAKDGKMCEGK